MRSPLPAAPGVYAPFTKYVILTEVSLEDRRLFLGAMDERMSLSTGGGTMGAELVQTPDLLFGVAASGGQRSAPRSVATPPTSAPG
jgi:hypothetical protein